MAETAAETTTEAAPPASPEKPAAAPNLFRGIDVGKLSEMMKAEAAETEVEEPAAEAAPEAEAAPAEAQAEAEPAKEEPKPEPLAKQFAALTKREQKLQQERKQWESEVKEREMDLAKKQAAMQDLLEDPLAALEKLGITYDKLTEQVLNGRKPPADLKQSAEQKRIREELEAIKKKDAEREAAIVREREAAAVEKYRAGLLAGASKAADEHELVLKYADHPDERFNSMELAIAAADVFVRETGKVPDMAEVLRHTEEYLRGVFEPALTTKFVQGKLSPKSAPQRASSGQSASPGQKPRTLTSTAAPAAGVSDKPRTERELRQLVASRLAASFQSDPD